MAYTAPAGTEHLSPQSTIRYGYSGNSYTLDAMADVWSWARLHPELRRRLLALFFAHPSARIRGTDNVGRIIVTTNMGVGGGARDPVRQRAEFLRRHSTRPTLRVPPRTRWFEGRLYWLRKGMAPYAPPGSSNHEDGTLEGWAAAADLVGWEDGWAAANAARFSLKHFANVNSEPWHYQLAEYPNSKKDLVAGYARGVRHSIARLVFPGRTARTFTERIMSGLPTVNATTPEHGRHIARVQAILWKFAIDNGLDIPNPNGAWGPSTEAVVRLFQSRRGLTVDGVVGQSTWQELLAVDLDAEDG